MRPSRYRRFARPFTPYSRLSAHRQRDAWIQLRGEIRSKFGRGTEQVWLSRHIEEPGRPKLWNQWADIYLLGLDGRTLWNVSLSTVRRDFWGTLSATAWEAVDARLTEEEKAADSAALDIKKLFVRIPGSRLFGLNPPPRLPHVSLGGKTVREARADTERELLKTSPPGVFERWSLDRGYAYGIGVQAVLEVDEMTPAACADFVARFRDHGEKAYQAARHATRFLPDTTEDDALVETETVSAPNPAQSQSG